MIVILVGIGNIIDNILFSKATLRTAVIFFYIGEQGISILIHASNLGIPFPKVLKVILERLKHNGDNGDNAENLKIYENEKIDKKEGK